jgi:hypothetical protein
MNFKKMFLSTNAIFEGDKILAINNICLSGKTLKEAIELLLNGSDIVTLKLSRKRYFNNEINKFDKIKIENDSKVKNNVSTGMSNNFYFNNLKIFL